jgi:hypothetical protein
VTVHFKNYIKPTSKKIVFEVEAFLKAYEEMGWTTEMAYRRDLYASIKTLIKAFIGLFVHPKLPVSEELIFFQGIKHSRYFELFNKKNLVIIGSWDEKRYAKNHGYNFTWSFPIESAIQVALARNFYILLFLKIYQWSKIFTKFKKVTFFNYEDTQPIGTFLASVGNSKSIHSHVQSICIQHGYFVKSRNDFKKNRYDGLISDVNFVIDEAQASLMNLQHGTYKVIGLPYDAQAAPKNALDILLVGTGSSNSGTSHFDDALNVFREIQEKLSSISNCNIWYRPHPDELIRPNIMSRVESTFKNIDRLPLIERMNRPQSIFVGVLSSLLYEARVAGHLVAEIEIYSELETIFPKHFTFQASSIDSFVHWATHITEESSLKSAQIHSKNQYGYLRRFQTALQDINFFIDKEGL